MISRSVALAVLLSLAAATPALAGPPPGDWTFVRKDIFRHYACTHSGKGDTVRVRVATWINGREKAKREGIGQYAAIARGGNGNLVSERSNDNWAGEYIQSVLKGARESDRVWIQGAYYGPAEPWSDGFRVGRLTRCDPR